jgi:hypothetical protein
VTGRNKFIFTLVIVGAWILGIAAFSSPALAQAINGNANGNSNGNGNGNNGNSNGKFSVRFRGTYRGVLTVIVTPGHLKFKGNLKDINGNASTVNTNVGRDGNHFSGTLPTPDGDVEVAGRLDPDWVDDEGNAHAARLVGLLRGEHGFSRLAGAKGSDDLDGETD